MFSSKKEDATPKYDRVDTLIGKSTNFKGNMEASGTVRVEGFFEGELKIDGDIVIGETGKIIGNIIASNAHVGGKIEGNLKVKGQVHLTSSSFVDGDIEVGNLVVDEGALFTGRCIMQSKSASDANEVKPENKSAAKQPTKQ
jgi:cytoskeletal protein CcmA (bactofilin family)